MLNAAYLYLSAAIVLEVAGTTCMKLSGGFTRPLPSVLLFVFYGACFAILTMALRSLDVGMCYAVWSGVGTLLTVAVGVGLFAEPMSWGKAASLALILAGVVGLRLAEA